MVSPFSRVGPLGIAVMMVLATLLIPLAGRADAARKRKAAKAVRSGGAFSEVIGQGPGDGTPGKMKRRDRVSGWAAEGSGGKAIATKAAAREERKLCQAALKRGRRQVRDDKLIEAKESLATCVRPVCGPTVRRSCEKVVSSNEAALPSVVPVVSRAPSSDVALKMDGQLLTAKLDGQAIAVNPGRHELTFSTEEKVFATKNVVVERGQKDQRIAVDGPPSSAATDVAEVSSRRPVRKPIGEGEKRAAAASTEGSETAAGEATSSDGAETPRRKAIGRDQDTQADSASAPGWPTYALAGVGLLGVGGYGALNWKGRQQNQALKDSCAPDCKASSVHQIRMIYLAADISLAVGIVALATSTYLYFRNPADERRSTDSLTGIRTFDLRPTAGGTLATIGGRFQ